MKRITFLKSLATIFIAPKKAIMEMFSNDDTFEVIVTSNIQVPVITSQINELPPEWVWEKKYLFQVGYFDRKPS